MTLKTSGLPLRGTMTLLYFIDSIFLVCAAQRLGSSGSGGVVENNVHYTEICRGPESTPFIGLNTTSRMHTVLARRLPEKTYPNKGAWQMLASAMRVRQCIKS